MSKKVTCGQRLSWNNRLIDVRRLPQGLAISALIHVGVLAYLVHHFLDAPDVGAATVPKTTVVEIIPAEPLPPPPPAPAVAPPMDVALLDPPPAPSKIEPHAPPPVHRDPGHAISTAPVVTAPEIGAGSGSDTPPTTAKPNLLGMRLTAPPPRIAVSGRMLNETAPRVGPDIPDVAPTGALHPSGGGTAKIGDGPIGATVDADGAIHFKDGKNFGLDTKLPTGKAIGDGLRKWYDSNDKTPADAEQERINNNRYRDADTKPDSGNVASVPLVGGHFDADDWLMRRHGQDPYASRKLKMMDATRDERAAVGAHHRAEQLSHAAEIMQKNLDQLWASIHDAAARKEALFELWDECAESGDTALVEGGAAARSLVIGFIRAHFPEGGPDAFTTAEIAACERKKQSHARFSPYH